MEFVTILATILTPVNQCCAVGNCVKYRSMDLKIDPPLHYVILPQPNHVIPQAAVMAKYHLHYQIFISPVDCLPLCFQTVNVKQRSLEIVFLVTVNKCEFVLE